MSFWRAVALAPFADEDKGAKLMNSSLVDLVMNILAPTHTFGVAGILYFPVLFFALYRAPWAQLHSRAKRHVFLASSVSLVLLWNIRTHLGLGIEFHLLGTTAVTLVLGWPLAIIAASLAQVGVALTAVTNWNTYSIEIVANGVVPVLVTQIVHRLAQWKLPAHFFVYVFVGAFLGGALAMATSRLTLLAYALATGTASGSAALSSAYLPLMALPEALLNGMLVTLLVAYRPQWVSTFDDNCYLQGK
jgi:uncharacterized membrane protein